jgi:hypothetical protein
MTWSFIKHVSQYLERPKLGEQKAPTLWPSSATAVVDGAPVGKCRRQAFFRFAKDNYYFDKKYDHLKPLVNLVNEYKTPTDKYMRWIWIQGELYEEYCINMAKESGIYIGSQVSIYVPGYNISGKIDLIVVDPETTNLHIVEVKSVYGFNANSVLGTDSQHKKGLIGTPRESHLMQLGIYQWWYGNSNEEFGAALLTYGARDTGRFAEYMITVEKGDDDLDYIFYQGHTPITTKKVNSNITIQSILENYKLLSDCLESEKDEIPAADYELLFTQEKIAQLHEQGLLSKTDATQYEKRKKQLEEGKNRVVKPVQKGDWQCRFCDYKYICHEEDGTQKEFSLQDLQGENGES